MNNNAKAILITILGVGLACFVVVVLMAAVVMFSLIAAAGGENEYEPNKTPVATSDKQRRKSGIELSKSKEKPARATEISSSGGEFAPEIVGKWYRSQGGGEVDYTGKSRYRSHRDYFYEFTADGAVDFSMEKDVLTIMQCEIKERRTARGQASTSNDTLTINLAESDFSGSNSCENDGQIIEKTLPAETVNLKWRLKTENEQTQLCFDEADGEACYDKKD